MKTIKDYHQGERFVYGQKNCMVLEHMNDGTLCIVLDEDFRSAFGKNNNFANSVLRDKLNTEYLNKWIDDGAFRADFVKMEVDLTADDGLKDYGTCECLLAPRTREQHSKYRYLIPNPTSYEWTSTAYSTGSNGYSDFVRYVNTSGALNFRGAYFAYGVRPLFKLNPESSVESEIKVKTDWDSGGNLESAIEHLQKAVDNLVEIENHRAEISIILGVIEILEKRRDDEIDD